MKRTVVLGGTGFVGRHVCARLSELGHPVLAVSRTPRPGAAIRSAALDLTASGPGPLAELLRAERAEVVVNAAGGVWNSDEDQMRKSNADLTGSLVEALAGLPWRPRLVHLGSAHEYGAVPHGSIVDESWPPEPLTAYGRTKLAATEQVLAAVRAGRLDAIVLRVSNVLGPGAPAASLTGAVARQLAGDRDGRAVVRLSPLRAHRDFVAAQDVAEAVALAAGTRCTGLVNIGSGTAVDVAGVVRRLVELSGVPAEVVFESRPPTAVRAVGDWQCLDISAARERLGWIPRRDLDSALADTWAAVAPVS
ncbi:Nucleoside-diphosphate-sugar epimerase [Amycolatopsis xylanica]|uniref:Nucleoside-diphosphate-sugar epimerase n=1 Tax=Amycolatopsis xylanica TaxID=589385 RepID=A0A1H2VSX3_9PSEU|nr:NAD(P)-dependent oxidoreductase [Amycolatopsis xylanica]SDW70979.1 Nucleoside-diphosphate-sugar epimerase [Amycolatopsis xylanica]